MSHVRRSVVASWALAVLAAVALAVGGARLYAEHTAFRSDAFADRAAAALERPEVQTALADRLTTAVVSAKPDLVTVRALIGLGAERVVGSRPFRSVVRRAALNAHRAAFEGDDDRPVVRIRNAGVLLAAVVRRLRPDLAARVPTDVVLPVVRVRDRVDGLLVSLARWADDSRPLAPIALVVALLATLAALTVGGPRRTAAFRLGAALAAVGGVLVVTLALAPAFVADRIASLDPAAVRVAVRAWTAPLAVWSGAAAVVGLVVALGAADVVRPAPVLPLVRQAGRILGTRPAGDRGRALRALVTLAVGVLVVRSPRGALTVALTAVGLVLIAAAAAELMALAAGPPRAAEAKATRGRSRTLRITGAAMAMVAAVVLTSVLIDSGEELRPAPVAGRCNGQAALCGRRLDDVAFLGTHNSMAADREPGWLFPAQEAGIGAQLREGVRALLVDTHYGFPARRGVVTDLSGPTQSRAKLVEEAGEQFVRTAERLRARLSPKASTQRELYLCHAFCEVGATQALAAFRSIHRFLVEHPEEVLVLSIQDDTGPADTAELVRESGLIDEVYRGRVAKPWPTLRQLIDRDERVLLLVEQGPPSEPWVHLQRSVAQETPYHFSTPAELAAPASCAPNRGGVEGSLFLVNHWVDTSPAPRVSIAKRVNARRFLEPRLRRCRARRRLLPNVVAVDFYREGDAQAVVDRLNGAPGVPARPRSGPPSATGDRG